MYNFFQGLVPIFSTEIFTNSKHFTLTWQQHSPETLTLNQHLNR